MGSRSIHEYGTANAPRRFFIIDVISLGSLVVGAYLLFTSPLLLSTPGGFVDSYLWCAGSSIFALAFARRWWLTSLALLFGAIALVFIHRDHAAGMEYARKRGQQEAMMEFRIPPYDK